MPDFVWIMLYILAMAWLLYRVFVAHKFLLWDWSDGMFQLVWNKPHYREKDWL